MGNYIWHCSFNVARARCICLRPWVCGCACCWYVRLRPNLQQVVVILSDNFCKKKNLIQWSGFDILPPNFSYCFCILSTQPSINYHSSMFVLSGQLPKQRDPETSLFPQLPHLAPRGVYQGITEPPEKYKARFHWQGSHVELGGLNYNGANLLLRPVSCYNSSYSVRAGCSAPLSLFVNSQKNQGRIRRKTN